MKQGSLNTLARMHRWELDQLRRHAGELQRQRLALIARDHALSAELERERQIAAEAMEFNNFGVFAQGVKAQRARLAQAVADLDRQLDALQEQITAAYQEMKRYETLEERQRERVRQSAIQREQAQLDEIGLNVHRRGRDAGG